VEMVVLGAVEWFGWVVLPALIFFARIADVSLGTVRVIFVSRGMKYLAPVVGFFEVLIWVVAIGQIMRNLSNPVCYLAYAGGFAAGNYVGIWIAEKLSLGVVMVRVIAKEDVRELVQRLREQEYGVTSVDAEGGRGPVKIVFTIVPRREVQSVVGLIHRFDPGAFVSVEEIGFVERGIFPLRRGWRGVGFLRRWRPFRKGK